MYNSERNLPLLASLIAKGVVTYAVGDAVTGTVTMASAGRQIVKAFAPDVTEHFVSTLDYAKLKEFLIQPKPGNLNHDLDRLIKSALIRAVGFIKRLYLDKLKEEQELTLWQKFANPFAEIEETLSTMERDLKSQLEVTSFDKDDLETYFTGEQTDIYDELTTYLFSVSEVDQTDTDWQRLRAFFSQQLPLLFDLAFKESLKEEGNAQAFKAFEIWILEEGLRNQKQQLAGQERIVVAIETLKAGQLSEDHGRLLEQIQADINSASAMFTQQLETVIAQLARIEQGVIRTEGKVDQANAGIQRAIEILEKGEGTKRTFPHQLTNIPAFGGEFIGRYDDLKLLKKTLDQSAKVVLMNGIGGIGKTTLAKWFAQQNLADYEHVCWIEVTRQDSTAKGKLMAGSLKEAIANNALLFSNLKLVYDPKEVSTDQRFEFVTNTLRNLPGRNLLVIDNAGDDAGDKVVRDQLPQPPNWQVLLTSRQSLNGYKVLALDTLNPQDAQSLFFQYYTFVCSVQEVTDLLEAIGYHTLTIELFAKTLEAHYGILSVSDLLRRVQERKLNDPDLQRTLETEHHPQETEVFLHLMMAFDCADLTEGEKSLLGQFTLLPPKPYLIQEQLTPLLAITDYSKLSVLAETLNQLVRKGWLTRVGHAYSLHRLIQQTLVYQLNFDWESAKATVGAVAELLNFEDNPNPLAVISQQTYGEFLINRIPEIYQKELETLDLKDQLALVYRELGYYSEAARILESVLKDYEEKLGPEHSLVSKIRSNLGAVYKDLGKYSEAASLVEVALRNDEKAFGPNHLRTAVKKANLAMAYKELGRQNEAIDLLQEAIEIKKTHFGPDDSSVSKDQSNLAIVFQDLHRHEEAVKLLEESSDSIERQLGSNHPNTATIKSNLALQYNAMGRHDEAVSLLQEALEIDRNNYGKDHPTTVLRQYNLATVYQNLGQDKEAVVMLEETLKYNERHYGITHPMVSKNQSSLAMAYVKLGRLEEAVSLMEMSLRGSIDHLGINHPDVALRQANLANLYTNSGRYPEAITLRQKALDSDKKRFGMDDHRVINGHNHLVELYRNLGKYNQAVKSLELVASSNERLYGVTHHRVATDRMRLGVILFEMNQLSKAAIQLQKAKEMFVWLFGEQHRDAQNCTVWLHKIKRRQNI